MRAAVDDAQGHAIPREFGDCGSDRAGSDDQDLVHQRPGLLENGKIFAESDM